MRLGNQNSSSATTLPIVTNTTQFKYFFTSVTPLLTFPPTLLLLFHFSSSFSTLSLSQHWEGLSSLFVKSRKVKQGSLVISKQWHFFFKIPRFCYLHRKGGFNQLHRLKIRKTWSTMRYIQAIKENMDKLLYIQKHMN